MRALTVNDLSVKNPRGQIDALTGMRAFAALWVVSLHYGADAGLLVPATARLDWFIGAGTNAVPMFFILSGFILLHTYRDRFDVFTWREYFRFLGLRLARIYPGYLAALGIMVALVLGAACLGVTYSKVLYPLPWLPLEALMLHAWVLPWGAPDRFSGWNYPDWSVSAEWFAYIFIFPLAVWLIKKTARLGNYSLVIILAGLLVLEPAIRTLWSLTMVSLLFLVGAWLWELHRRVVASGKKPPRHLDSIALLSLFVTVWFFWGRSWYASPLLLASIALLIFGLCRADGLVSRLFATRVMVFLGEISYSIYLVHGVVLRLLKIILPTTRYAHSSMPVRAGVLTIEYASVLVAATLLFFAVEHPARLWLRRRFARPQTQR